MKRCEDCGDRKLYPFPVFVIQPTRKWEHTCYVKRVCRDCWTKADAALDAEPGKVGTE